MGLFFFEPGTAFCTIVFLKNHSKGECVAYSVQLIHILSGEYNDYSIGRLRMQLRGYIWLALWEKVGYNKEKECSFYAYDKTVFY